MATDLERMRDAYLPESDGLRRLQERRRRREHRVDGVMRYRGVFQRALEYKAGDAVTCDGALWVALRDVEAAGEKPGTAGGDAFQLVCKSGR